MKIRGLVEILVFCAIFSLPMLGYVISHAGGVVADVPGGGGGGGIYTEEWSTTTATTNSTMQPAAQTTSKTNPEIGLVVRGEDVFIAVLIGGIAIFIGKVGNATQQVQKNRKQGPPESPSVMLAGDLDALPPEIKAELMKDIKKGLKPTPLTPQSKNFMETQWKKHNMDKPEKSEVIETVVDAEMVKDGAGEMKTDGHLRNSFRRDVKTKREKWIKGEYHRCPNCKQDTPKSNFKTVELRHGTDMGFPLTSDKYGTPTPSSYHDHNHVVHSNCPKSSSGFWKRVSGLIGREPDKIPIKDLLPSWEAHKRDMGMQPGRPITYQQHWKKGLGTFLRRLPKQ
jgi:hypothetical protein